MYCEVQYNFLRYGNNKFYFQRQQNFNKGEKLEQKDKGVVATEESMQWWITVKEHY